MSVASPLVFWDGCIDQKKEAEPHLWALIVVCIKKISLLVRAVDCRCYSQGSRTHAGKEDKMQCLYDGVNAFKSLEAWLML